MLVPIVHDAVRSRVLAAPSWVSGPSIPPRTTGSPAGRPRSRAAEGFSGADIKYICDRAASVSFLGSVASGEVGQISAAILRDVLAATEKSVTPQILKRFEQWAAEAARA